MKVLHLINTLSAGGAELHLLTLSRYLQRLNADAAVACLREQLADSLSPRADFAGGFARIFDCDLFGPVRCT